MHNVQVTPIIGLPQLDGWSHVTQNQSSTLIWNVSLHGTHARNVGRDLLDLISNSEPTNSADFYRIFQQIIVEAQDKNSSLSCAAIYFEEDIVTFATYDAQILLRRDSKVGTLLNGLETTKIIQGKAQPDDVIILATAKAVIFLDEVRLKIKQGYDVDTVVTSLTPSLQLEENSSLAALAFIQVKASKRDEPVLASSEFENQSELVSEQVQMFEPAVFEPAVVEVIQPEQTTQRTMSAEYEQPNQAEDPTTNSTVIDISQGTDVAIDFVKKTAVTLFAFSKKTAIVVAKQLENVGSTFKKNAPGYIAKSKSVSHSTQDIVQKILRRVFNQDVYVDSSQSKKIARYAVVAVVVLLIAAAIFGWFRLQRANQLEAVRVDLAPLQQEFEQVIPNISTAPLLARDQIVRIQDQIVALQQVYQDSPVALQILNSFAQQVQSTYEEVAGREELQDLPIFFNFLNVEDKFIGSEFAIQDTKLWVLDGDTQRIAQVNLDTKESQIYSFAQSETQESQTDTTSEASQSATQDNTQNTSQQRLKSFAVNSDASTVYAMGANILQLNIESGETEELVESRTELQGARMIRLYGTNMYIFNPQQQNIFRFTIEDGSTTTPRGWVRSSQGLQYDQVLSMAIDGDIWLGSRTGNVLRMRSGQPEPFTISGLEKPFETDVVVYTQESFDHVYILESNANRVVQLTKDGAFIREIVSPTLAAVSSIVVTTDESSILALSGSLIYELEM